MLCRYYRELTGRFGWSFVLSGVLALTGVGSAAADTILGVAVQGQNLAVDVQLPGDIDPTVPLHLSLLSNEGLVVAAQSAFPPDGGSTLSVEMPAHWVSLPERGWQHKLELKDNSSVLDTVDLRFGLDCTAEPCQITVQQDLFVEGAVHVNSVLMERLSQGEPLSLAALAEAEPDLAGSVFEASVDIGGIQEEPGQCECFFLSSTMGAGSPRGVISGRWNPDLGEEGELVLHYRWQKYGQTANSLQVGSQTAKESTLDFKCFRVTPGGPQPVLTHAGILTFAPPELEPCTMPCSPTIVWNAEPFWGAYIDSHIDVSTFASYDVEWLVDGISRFRDDQSWTVNGAQFQPLDRESPLTGNGISVLASALPTTMHFGGSAFASVSQVTKYDRPQIDVAAGAYISATGKAKCAVADVEVTMATTELPPGVTPATLVIVLGDDTDP
ncbi:MAG: hypothetical protein AAGM22_07395 [Acidobacteriota bacterium]